MVALRLLAKANEKLLPVRAARCRASAKGHSSPGGTVAELAATCADGDACCSAAMTADKKCLSRLPRRPRNPRTRPCHCLPRPRCCLWPHLNWGSTKIWVPAVVSSSAHDSGGAAGEGGGGSGAGRVNDDAKCRQNVGPTSQATPALQGHVASCQQPLLPLGASWQMMNEWRTELKQLSLPTGPWPASKRVVQSGTQKRSASHAECVERDFCARLVCRRVQFRIQPFCQCVHKRSVWGTHPGEGWCTGRRLPALERRCRGPGAWGWSASDGWPARQLPPALLFLPLTRRCLARLPGRSATHQLLTCSAQRRCQATTLRGRAPAGRTEHS